MTIQTNGARKINALTEIENLEQAVLDLGIPNGLLIEGGIKTKLEGSLSYQTLKENDFLYIFKTNSTDWSLKLPSSGFSKCLILNKPYGGPFKIETGFAKYTDTLDSNNSAGIEQELFYVIKDPSKSRPHIVRIADVMHDYNFYHPVKARGAAHYGMRNHQIVIPDKQTVIADTSMYFSKNSSSKLIRNSFFLIDTKEAINDGRMKTLRLRNLHTSARDAVITKRKCFLHISANGGETYFTDMFNGYTAMMTANSYLTINDEWGYNKRASFDRPLKQAYHEVITTTDTTEVTTSIAEGMFKIVSSAVGAGDDDRVTSTIYAGSRFKQCLMYQETHQNAGYNTDVDTLLFNHGAEINQDLSLNFYALNSLSGKPICDVILIAHRKAGRDIVWRTVIDWHVEPWT